MNLEDYELLKKLKQITPLDELLDVVNQKQKSGKVSKQLALYLMDQLGLYRRKIEGGWLWWSPLCQG